MARTGAQRTEDWRQRQKEQGLFKAEFWVNADERAQLAKRLKELRDKDREEGCYQVEYWLTPIERRVVEILLDNMRDEISAKKRWEETR